MKSLEKPQGYGLIESRIRKCTRLEYGIHKQYLVVKEGLKINMVTLMLVKSWKREGLKTRLWLVVATKLQALYLSSGCVPWVIYHPFKKNVIIGFICQFQLGHAHSILQFYLKKHLGELVQFKTKVWFRRLHQPVRTNMWLGFKHKEFRGHEIAC
jgi:hypothetical protein